jgi:cell division protein FtsZ
MTTKLNLSKITDLKPRIAVVGVGGAGGNAVNNMIAAGLSGVEFIVANTDAQALSASSAEHRIQLGQNLTEGLGAGSKPEIGEAAAEEALEEIRSMVTGCHMVFIAAGMGGGTGTGAASVIARVARDLGILTVAVVTKPFQFEGSRRMRVAEAGIADLKNHVDTIIVIPNQNLFRIANERTTFAEAFVLADQVLYSGIACIVDLIIKEGLINLDLADVRAVLTGMGTAMMGTGEADGDRRAILAAEEAIANPLIDDVTLKGAKGLLLSIIGGETLTLYEVDEAASRVRQEVDPEANIIVGATFDKAMGDRVRVSIVASGMTRAGMAAPQPAPQPAQQAGLVVPPSNAAPHGWPALPQGKFAMTPPPPLPNSMQGAGSFQPANPLQQRAPDSAMRPARQFADPLQVNSHDNNMATTMGSRDQWHDDGNVMIEEAVPQFSNGAQPIPHLERALQYDQPSTKVASQPQPTAPQSKVLSDTRRQGRRMPEIDDFPPVGQRVLQAKNGVKSIDFEASNQHRSADAPTKKGSLLHRLTGGALGRAATSDRGGRDDDGKLPDFFQSAKKTG